MTLTETGESRVRGYLYVLERSLRTFLPAEVTSDAVREVESHIRERLQASAIPDDERATVQRVLADLGPPLCVAQAYSAEMAVDQAIATGRVLAIGRALWHVATSNLLGFFAALGLFIGYAVGAGFVAIALLKPIFPQNVGFIFRDGMPMSFGAEFALPPGAEVRGGYWVIPFALLIGLAILILSHATARWLLPRWRRRPSTWTRKGG